MEFFDRWARRILGRATPSPERLALKSLIRSGRRVPSRTPGRIKVGPYQIEYNDIGKLAAQWKEIFVDRHLQFTTQTSSPRVLDCGGNLGIATLYFKSCYPTAKVTTFEADPDIYALCHRNILANRYLDVEVVNSAVWVETGETTFLCEGTDSGTLSQLAEGSAVGPRRIVPTIRLRDYLLAETIDLLKLDIEGAEFDVIADCADQLSKVSRVIVELHETDPTNRRTAEVLGILTAAGFQFTMTGLVPMVWRDRPYASMSPFPGKLPTWVVMVYAWQV